MIAEVENAIAARIKAASDAGALGYQLRAVEIYAGQFDDGLRGVAKQFPAVWVALRALGRGEPAAGYGWRVPATFTVFVAAQSRRSQRAARHGAAGEVGVLQIVRDVRALLIGQRLGLDIEPIEPGAVTGLAGGAEGSVYAIDLHTAWIEEAAPEIAGGIADFQTFHADWDIPPLGNVAPPLPAAAPDASDTVTLEMA